MIYLHLERLKYNMMDRLLTLLETARMNNLLLNPDKIQFKSADYKFFGHRLTPEGLKLDPQKVKATVQMPPPTVYPESTEFQWYGTTI